MTKAFVASKGQLVTRALVANLLKKVVLNRFDLGQPAKGMLPDYLII